MAKNPTVPPSTNLKGSKRLRSFTSGETFPPRTPDLMCSTVAERTPLTENDAVTSAIIHEDIDLNIIPLRRVLEDEFISTIPTSPVVVLPNG